MDIATCKKKVMDYVAREVANESNNRKTIETKVQDIEEKYKDRIDDLLNLIGFCIENKRYVDLENYKAEKGGFGFVEYANNYGIGYRHESNDGFDLVFLTPGLLVPSVGLAAWNVYRGFYFENSYEFYGSSRIQSHLTTFTRDYENYESRILNQLAKNCR